MNDPGCIRLAQGKIVCEHDGCTEPARDLIVVGKSPIGRRLCEAHMTEALNEADIFEAVLEAKR